MPVRSVKNPPPSTRQLEVGAGGSTTVDEDVVGGATDELAPGWLVLGIADEGTPEGTSDDSVGVHVGYIVSTSVMVEYTVIIMPLIVVIEAWTTVVVTTDGLAPGDSDMTTWSPDTYCTLAVILRDLTFARVDSVLDMLARARYCAGSGHVHGIESFVFSRTWRPTTRIALSDQYQIRDWPSLGSHECSMVVERDDDSVVRRADDLENIFIILENHSRISEFNTCAGGVASSRRWLQRSIEWA